MAQAAPSTGFDFDHASLNLAPQQPSRVRRAWERVPTKAAQRKDRTVWKRADPKPIQYATEQGGTGFAVQGTKRLRMKNVPAFPVKAGRGIDREEEAEATDDELFSRRRKSGRRSSINPARKPIASPKSRLISAPRPSRQSANPLRSPLKNLRVMELAHSPAGKGKRARPSIGGILGNGTPMRNAFTEPSWPNRSPSRVPLSPKNDISSQKPFSVSMTSPSRQFSPRKDFSPQKISTPQKIFSTQKFPSGATVSLFSPEINIKMSTPNADTTLPKETHNDVPSQAESFVAAVEQQPRRRSARLSNSSLAQDEPVEQPTATQQETQNALELTEPTGSLWLAPPVSETIPNIGLDEQISLQQIGIETSLKTSHDEIDEPSLQLQAELGAPISPAKITLFPKQGKADPVDDEDQTALFTSINATFDAENTPERLTSPRKRSPQKLADLCLPLNNSPESGPIEIAVTERGEEQPDDVDCEIDEASDDEMTARLEDWTDPAVMSPSEPEPKVESSRNAPRFSDDTTILKAFLSRAQAKRDAQALTAASGPSVRASPRRSPRRALESVDGNSPSQPKSPMKSTSAKSPKKTADPKARLGNTPPSKPAMMLTFDADESDELASPVKTIRRSARPKPTTTTQSSSSKMAPSLIPLRRTDGQEPTRLRKTEAQELAIVTRSNTRRNRGQAQMPLFVLQDLSTRELSPVKPRPSLPGSKSVDWNAELVEFLGEETKRKTKVTTTKTTTTTTQPQHSIPKATKTAAGGVTKRSKGLGTANGTPARSRTAISTNAGPSVSLSAAAAAAGATPARPRPRKA